MRCLHANGYTFAAITELDCRGSEFEAIYKFAVTERLFYQQLKIIQKAIIEPLIKTGKSETLTFKDSAYQGYRQFCRCCRLVAICLVYVLDAYSPRQYSTSTEGASIYQL